MGTIAKRLGERLERWRNAQFRAETRRVLAREATASLGAPVETVAGGAALDELEARLWSRIDRQIQAETGAGVPRATPNSAARAPRGRFHRLPRTFELGLPALAAAALVFALMSAPKPVHDGVKGAPDPGYAPVVEALRIAVVDGQGHIQRGEDGMSVKVGDALVFEAEVRGLETERGLAVDLTYTVDGAPDEAVVRDFALKAERQRFQTEGGYVAFKPTRSGDYTFRLKAAREPNNAREMRVHVEEIP